MLDKQKTVFLRHECNKNSERTIKINVKVQIVFWHLTFLSDGYLYCSGSQPVYREPKYVSLQIFYFPV